MRYTKNTIISLEIDGSLSFGNFMDNNVDQVTNEDIIKDVKYLKPDNLNVNEESVGRNYCDNHKVTQRLIHVNNDIKLEEKSQEYEGSHFDQSVGMKNDDNDITRLDVLDVVVEMDNSGYNQSKNTKNVLEKSSFVDVDVAIDALNNVEILHGGEVVDCFHSLNEEFSYNDSQRTIENIFTKTPITDHDIVAPNDFVSTSPSEDINGDSKIKSSSDKLDTIIAPINNSQVSQLNDYYHDNIEGNYGNLQDSENDEDFGPVLEDIQEEEMEYEDLTGHKNAFFDNNDDDEIMKIAITNPLSSSFNSVQTNYENIPYSSSVIIDPGSNSIKAGFSIDEKPRVVIPSIVGYSPKSDFCYKNFYVGDEGKHLHHVINMNKPVKKGLVHNWELFEKLLDEVFEELRCEADQYPVLLTEPVLVPKTQREDIVQLLFETYHVPSMYSSSQASLALFATGRTTGVVYDCGYGKCHSVPVYEGYPFPHATFTTEFAGDELTMCLSRMLKDRGINVECNTSISIAEDIKRRLCYVVMDYDNERRAYNFGERKDTSYMLPDGKMIQIGSECFRCPELLFSPSMAGIDIDGVHEMIYKSIFRCSFDMRTSLLENIVIAGGSTMFTGFNRRLHVELSKLAGPQDTVKICAVDERNMLTWQGGSMLSKVPSFHSMWISSSEYDEFGPNIVHRKCV
ncbi:actin-100-like [Xenia sp. Carnegie-2017]|uniref:actin-100-like n=1 Tax=Xenia sp. Carnegie-2017 TaxID=2897299 RepID=UPI001F036D55|nr:actin-100-like [Xenia sp. Carnegie-2017]